MLNKITTVKELREFIKDLPDDMPIAAYESNMERSGYFNRVCLNIVKMKETINWGRDAFDGTEYSYKILYGDKNGKEYLKFY